MKLETAQRISSKSVSKEELINAFFDDKGRGEYIILSHSNQEYIQASGEYDDPYLVEYREGDSEHHFQSTHDVSKKTVQSLFIKYLNGNNSWKTDIEWKQLGGKPWWKFW